MSTFSFRIIKDDSKAVLTLFQKDAHRTLIRTIRGRIKTARRDMISRARKRSGRLAGGIDLVIPPFGISKLSLVGIAGIRDKALFYGRFLEFGTSRMRAKPFILPAFTRAMRGVEAEITKALSR